jgi:hypothetical protein
MSKPVSRAIIPLEALQIATTTPMISAVSELPAVMLHRSAANSLNDRFSTCANRFP